MSGEELYVLRGQRLEDEQNAAEAEHRRQMRRQAEGKLVCGLTEPCGLTDAHRRLDVCSTRIVRWLAGGTIFVTKNCL